MPVFLLGSNTTLDIPSPDQRQLIELSQRGNGGAKYCDIHSVKSHGLKQIILLLLKSGA